MLKSRLAVCWRAPWHGNLPQGQTVSTRALVYQEARTLGDVLKGVFEASSINQSIKFYLYSPY